MVATVANSPPLVRDSEVVAHPWLKTPGSSSQASLHPNQSVPTLGKSSTIIEDAEGVGQGIQLLMAESSFANCTTKRCQGLTRDSTGLGHNPSPDSGSNTCIDSLTENDYGPLSIANEKEDIALQVLSRLSFKGIEDLTPRILAVARQIHKDTEVIKASLIRRDLLTEEQAKALAEKVREIDNLTSPEDVKSLIASGAKLCPEDWHEALTAALESKNQKCLIALLQCEADFSFMPPRRSRFRSALTFAASSGNEAGVWALFSAGASVSPYSDKEREDMLSERNLENTLFRPTPLVEALTHGHLNILRFLLANGANPREFGVVVKGVRKPHKTYSPLMALLMTEPRPVDPITLELDGSQETDEQTSLLLQEKKLKMGDLLIEAGASWNFPYTGSIWLDDSRNWHFNNPFQVAVWLGHDRLLAWLADKAPKAWCAKAFAMNLAVVQAEWKCFDILAMGPYRLDENLHCLIHSYMTCEWGSHMSWDAFSRAIGGLLKAGFDPQRKVKFAYVSRMTGQLFMAHEKVSAQGLVSRISSKCDRGAIAELLN